MTREEMREMVAEAMWQAESLRAVGQRRVIKWSDAGSPTWDKWSPLADAAIAVIRGEVLEEAARVADTHRLPFGDPVVPYKIAAAIRALKEGN